MIIQSACQHEPMQPKFMFFVELSKTILANFIFLTLNSWLCDMWQVRAASRVTWNKVGLGVNFKTCEFVINGEWADLDTLCWLEEDSSFILFHLKLSHKAAIFLHSPLQEIPTKVRLFWNFYFPYFYFVAISNHIFPLCSTVPKNQDTFILF